MELEAAFAFAISNIAAFGDTDVFPSPFERFLFADLQDRARSLLQEMHKNSDFHLASFPPQNFDTLCPVGYTGFRWVTQIDPIWNAYFLGLVVSIADTIEKSRIAEGERVVFSYRFSPNPETKHLFSDSSWFDFKRRSLELAKQHEFVLVTDIADFYPRVYHHRLENELRRLNLKSDIPSRIMKLLSHFSKTVSYGLPVGSFAWMEARTSRRFETSTFSALIRFKRDSLHPWITDQTRSETPYFGRCINGLKDRSPACAISTSRPQALGSLL